VLYFSAISLPALKISPAPTVKIISPGEAMAFMASLSSVSIVRPVDGVGYLAGEVFRRDAQRVFSRAAYISVSITLSGRDSCFINSLNSAFVLE
jgi:hypothetical protein